MKKSIPEKYLNNTGVALAVFCLFVGCTSLYFADWFAQTAENFAQEQLEADKQEGEAYANLSKCVHDDYVGLYGTGDFKSGKPKQSCILALTGKGVL